MPSTSNSPAAASCRSHQPGRRGLVWHTQGSGKTFTMIKAPESNKPTVLPIDRNELEDQMLRNLAALGLADVERATSIARRRLYRERSLRVFSLCWKQFATEGGCCWPPWRAAKPAVRV